MRAKLLTGLLALGILCSFGQGLQPPQRFEHGTFSQVSPHQAIAKSIQTKGGHDATTRPVLNNKARADLTTYNVDFVLDFDTQTQNAYSIYLANNDTEASNDNAVFTNYSFGVYDLIKGSNVLPIPSGKYDIIVLFQTPDPTTFKSIKNMYVIREEVEINQDTELHFSSDEAKNHIHFQILMMDGEPINWGKFIQDEGSNWVQTETCNVDNAIFVNSIIHKDYGIVMDMSTNSQGGYYLLAEDWGEKAAVDYFNGAPDFYVNDVSDRYAFHHYMAFLDDGVVYTSALEADGANSDVVLTTNPEKYVLFEDPFQISENSNEELYKSIAIFSLREGTGLGSTYMDIQKINFMTPMTNNETFKCYLNASADDSKVGFVPYLQPVANRKVINTWGWMFDAAMSCIPLTKTNDEIVFANNGTSVDYVQPGIYFGAEYGEGNIYGHVVDFTEYPHRWPSHPVFTYSTDKKKENLGNNCPLLVSRPIQYERTYSWEDEDGNPVSFTSYNISLSCNYNGRYGERKKDAETYALVNIKFDGEEVYSGEGCRFSAQLDQFLDCVVDATITNELVKVDNLAGSNRAQLHYTAGAEDENPPTMTMLHFKDINGDVTERFATGEEGTLEFTAGDFNLHMTPIEQYMAYDRCAPETVEVSYSPYGEDNWNELSVEEVPENYWPVMGWFYTGSLAGVTSEAYEGWFDLKIRLEDAAGNWQEQVISPAFRIDDLAYSSVANIGSDNAHEVARYSIDGKRVDASHRGVTIIKMSDGTARKVIL